MRLKDECEDEEEMGKRNESGAKFESLRRGFEIQSHI